MENALVEFEQGRATAREQWATSETAHIVQSAEWGSKFVTTIRDAGYIAGMRDVVTARAAQS